MRLIKFELLKIFSNRLFLLLLAISALFNLLFLNYQNHMQETTAVPYSAYQQLNNDLRGKNHEEKGRLIQEAYERVYAIQLIYNVQNNLKSEDPNMREYGAALRSEHLDYYQKYYEEANQQPEFRYSNDCGTEYSLLEQIKNDYDKVDGYQKTIQEIVTESDELQNVSIFQQKNNVSLNNIRKTKDVYRQMEHTAIDFQIDEGMKLLTKVSVTDFLVLLLIFLAAALLINEEKEKNLFTIIKSTVNGQMKTILAKSAALMLSVILIAVLFYGMNLLFICYTIGCPDLSASVQSMAFLMLSPLKVNIGTYLLIFYLSKLCTLILFALLVLYFAIRFHHITESTAAAVIVMIIGYLMYHSIDANSAVSLLKAFNFIALLHQNELYATYSCIRFFDFVLDKVTVVITLELLSIALLIGLSIDRYLKKMNTGRKENRIMVMIQRHSIVSHQKLYRLFSFELYKLLVMNKAVIVLILYVLFSCFHYQQQTHGLSFQESFYKGYMEMLSGELTPEKEKLMQTAAKEYEDAQNGLNRIDELVKAKKLTQSEAAAASIPYEDILATQDDFDRVKAKYEYVKAHPAAHFVYDSGYLKLFRLRNQMNENDLYLMIATLIAVMNIFIMEYKSGFIQIMNSMYKGRKTTAVSKIGGSLLVATVFFIVYMIFDLAQIQQMYGFPELHASLTSLEAFTQMPVPMTILQYLICFYLIRYLSYLLIILCIHKLCITVKHTIGSFVVSLFVILLPYFFYQYVPTLLQCFPLMNLSWACHHISGLPIIASMVFLTVFLYNNLIKRWE